MDKKYLVNEADETVYYVPNWINENEEGVILRNVYASPKPKWVQLSGRRLQNWGGVPHMKGMIAEQIPQWLMKHVDRVSDLHIYCNGDKRANHVLVNEYLPGQGIMPHEDGPLFHPVIATVSCGSHTVLEVCKKENHEERFSLLLERRSLVVLTDRVYTDYLHSIQELDQDTEKQWANAEKLSLPLKSLQRQARISLTIRHVPQTIHAAIRLSKT